jgi:DNA repair protein RadA/Sms
VTVRCILCHAEALHYAPRCPGCLKPNTLRHVETAAHERDRDGNAARAGSTVFALPVPSEAEPLPMRARTESLSRASTGFRPLDLALGGGLVAGSAILLSGEKGAGKSTLGLWMLKAFAGAALLAASEETREQVEERVTRTLPDTLGCPLICTRSVDAVLRYAQGKRLTLLDSVHLLDGKVEDNAKRLFDFSKANATTLVCIAQLTKDGRSVRGGAIIEYLFDTLLKLEREFPEDLGNPVRRIEVRKNRYGAEGAWRLSLGPEGWTEAPEAPPPEASGPKGPEGDTPRTGAPTNLRVLRTPPGSDPARR